MARTEDAIAKEIQKTNDRLERVKLRKKGGRLYMRATLPPKPGNGDNPKQYDIASGCNTSPAGIKAALAKALELESAIMRDRFDWSQHLKKRSKNPQTGADWIALLEKNHWKGTPKTPTTEETWHCDYELPLLRLPQERDLTAKLLLDTIDRETEPASRSRKLFCGAYSRLAKLAGIEGINFTKLAAG